MTRYAPGKDSDKAFITFTVRNSNDKMQVIRHQGHLINANAVGFGGSVDPIVNGLFISRIEEGADPHRPPPTTPRRAHDKMKGLFAAERSLTSAFAVKKLTTKHAKIGFK